MTHLEHTQAGQELGLEGFPKICLLFHLDCCGDGAGSDVTFCVQITRNEEGGNVLHTICCEGSKHGLWRHGGSVFLYLVVTFVTLGKLTAANLMFLICKMETVFLIELLW